MSESKARLEQRIEHLSRIAREAAALLELVDDAGGEIEDRYFDGLRAALQHRAGAAPVQVGSADAREGAAQAQAGEDARDAARYRYIEEHATTNGGGKGFVIKCFVPVDHEDMGCGIDEAMAAPAQCKSNQGEHDGRNSGSLPQV